MSEPIGSPQKPSLSPEGEALAAAIECLGNLIRRGLDRHGHVHPGPTITMVAKQDIEAAIRARSGLIKIAAHKFGLTLP